MTPEGKLTKRIIDHLKLLKKDGANIWWFKLHGHPMQTAGVPDLLVILEGRHIFFEIKIPGKSVTQLQQIRINEINAAKGEAVVVHSLINAKSFLKNE